MGILGKILGRNGEAGGPEDAGKSTTDYESMMAEAKHEAKDEPAYDRSRIRQHNGPEAQQAERAADAQAEAAKSLIELAGTYASISETQAIKEKAAAAIKNEGEVRLPSMLDRAERAQNGEQESGGSRFIDEAERAGISGANAVEAMARAWESDPAEAVEDGKYVTKGGIGFANRLIAAKDPEGAERFAGVLNALAFIRGLTGASEPVEHLEANALDLERQVFGSLNPEVEKHGHGMFKLDIGLDTAVIFRAYKLEGEYGPGYNIDATMTSTVPKEVRDDRLQTIRQTSSSAPDRF